jgi:esterase
MLELNYKTFGQGEPIVILHGLLGTLDNWQTLGKKLAEHFTVYLVDQRNHGRSPHDDLHSYPAMAEDLHHFMESHWMFKASLIGHSMGGKTAMHFARTHPDMVDKLMVVDIAPKPYPGGHETIIEALHDLDLDRIESRGQANEALASSISDEGIRQFLLKNLSRSKSGGYQWKMNLPALWAHYEAILASPEAPPFDGNTLFIRGGQSDYIQQADEPLLREHFPNARLETIPQAGHWVHAEAPDELLKLLLGFMKEG